MTETIMQSKPDNVPWEILQDLQEAHDSYPAEYRNPDEGEWTRYELLDHYLRWNGVLGYTGYIAALIDGDE